MSLFLCKDNDTIFDEFCSLKMKSVLSQVNKYYKSFYKNKLFAYYDFYNYLRTDYKKFYTDDDRKYNIYYAAIRYNNLEIIKYVCDRYEIVITQYEFTVTCYHSNNINIIKWIYDKLTEPLSINIYRFVGNKVALEFLFKEIPLTFFPYTRINVLLEHIICDMDYNSNVFELLCSKIDSKVIDKSLIHKSCQKFTYFKVLCKKIQDPNYLHPICVSDLIHTTNLKYINEIIDQHGHNASMNEALINRMCEKSNRSLFNIIVSTNLLNASGNIENILITACRHGNYFAVKLIDTMYDIKIINPNVSFLDICNGGSVRIAKLFIHKANSLYAIDYLTAASKKYKMFDFIYHYFCEHLLSKEINNLVFEALCQHNKINIIKNIVQKYPPDIIADGLNISIKYKHIQLAKYLSGFVEISQSYLITDPDIEAWINTKILIKNEK